MKIKIVQHSRNEPGGRICPWAIDNPPDGPRK